MWKSVDNCRPGHIQTASVITTAPLSGPSSEEFRGAAGERAVIFLGRVDVGGTDLGEVRFVLDPLIVGNFLLRSSRAY